MSDAPFALPPMTVPQWQSAASSIAAIGALSARLGEAHAASPLAPLLKHRFAYQSALRLASRARTPDHAGAYARLYGVPRGANAPSPADLGAARDAEVLMAEFLATAATDASPAGTPRPAGPGVSALLPEGLEEQSARRGAPPLLAVAESLRRVLGGTPVPQAGLAALTVLSREGYLPTPPPPIGWRVPRPRPEGAWNVTALRRLAGALGEANALLTAVHAFHRDAVAATRDLRSDSAARPLLPALAALPVVTQRIGTATFGLSAQTFQTAIGRLVERGVARELTGRRKWRVWAANDLRLAPVLDAAEGVAMAPTSTTAPLRALGPLPPIDWSRHDEALAAAIAAADALLARARPEDAAPKS
ncbi:hypothetical protein [Parvularcula dongshanensis]|uniref:Uncharacterized protein n=1 Tax=Parvularcula dongshanensis TaxID=1173995 RepID=A0A840I7G1_9PROT|nr:hypothetical protein [Parvularcula dongshanensis]MBB4660265.1 hypothetical protein [Parvularcula dongshanensis]